MVEESFSALPKLHSKVRKVIPVALRRWRHNLFRASTWQEIRAFRCFLSAETYDFVIDTQGLFKSGLLMSSAHGVHCGYDWQSAREPLASLFYKRTFQVARTLHAVDRNRQLASLALNMGLSEPADFGIQPPVMEKPDWLRAGQYVVMLHATSRDDKLWEEAKWIELGKRLLEQGILSVFPWGSEAERVRAVRLAERVPNAIFTPKLNLPQVASLLSGAYAVVGVDTGIAHLAAALNIPSIGLYTATDPKLTGIYLSATSKNLGGVLASPSVDEVLSAMSSILA